MTNKKEAREAKSAMLRERQTSRGLVFHSREYQRAAQLIADQVGTDDVTGGLKDTVYHNPFYYLCGHSLELSIKSTLLAAGRSHAELTAMGHDLARCLEEARSSYPTYDWDGYQDIVSLLNQSYVTKELEYRITGAKEWPLVIPLLFVVDEFWRWSHAIVHGGNPPKLDFGGAALKPN